MDDKLTKAIKNIYASSEKPVLLSHLGLKLAEEGIYIEGKLRSIIEEKVDGFSVIRNPTHPERVAITTPEDEENVKKYILDDINLFRSDNEALKNIRELPRSLIFAFSKKNDDGEIYISTNPPFKFKVNPSEPKDDEVLIEEKYRKDIFLKKNFRSMPDDEINDLWARIQQWAKDTQIDIKTFNKKELVKDETTTVTSSNLLEAIISALPQESHKRITLPLDIIQQLSNTKIKSE